MRAGESLRISLAFIQRRASPDDAAVARQAAVEHERGHLCPGLEYLSSSRVLSNSSRLILPALTAPAQTTTAAALPALSCCARSGLSFRAMPSTLVHSIGGTVGLVVILVLNVYKPQGMTRYGWRQQQKERTQREQRTALVL